MTIAAKDVVGQQLPPLMCLRTPTLCRKIVMTAVDTLLLGMLCTMEWFVVAVAFMFCPARDAGAILFYDILWLAALAGTVLLALAFEADGIRSIGKWITRCRLYTCAGLVPSRRQCLTRAAIKRLPIAVWVMIVMPLYALHDGRLVFPETWAEFNRVIHGSFLLAGVVLVAAFSLVVGPDRRSFIDRISGTVLLREVRTRPGFAVEPARLPANCE